MRDLPPLPLVRVGSAAATTPLAPTVAAWSQVCHSAGRCASCLEAMPCHAMHAMPDVPAIGHAEFRLALHSFLSRQVWPRRAPCRHRATVRRGWLCRPASAGLRGRRRLRPSEPSATPHRLPSGPRPPARWRSSRMTAPGFSRRSVRLPQRARAALRCCALLLSA